MRGLDLVGEFEGKLEGLAHISLALVGVVTAILV